MAKLSYKENTAFARAARIIGGTPYSRDRVIEMLGVSGAQISYYKTGKNKINIALARKIEQLTFGEVTFDDLNPSNVEFHKHTTSRRMDSPSAQSYSVGDINVNYRYWILADNKL